MVLFAAHHKQLIVLAPTAWQHPYVNVFKHFGVGQWKKCSKEGDVSTYMVRMFSKQRKEVQFSPLLLVQGVARAR